MSTDVPFDFDPELDLTFERIVDVSPEDIYRHYTNAELLKPWFCPRPWRVESVVVEARPGGAFKTVMVGPNGERMDGEAGCVLEAVPGQRFAWTDALGPGFRPRKEPGFMSGHVYLAPTEDGGTRYRALARHSNPEARKQHAEMGFEPGWGAALDQLVRLIKTGSVD